MGYLGKQPALQASEYREEFNITSTTTNIITSGFVRTGSSNYLEVYRNGVLLGKADYTLQSDYKTIVLTNAAVAGDIVVVLGRRNLTQGLKVAERRHEHVIQNGETTVTFPFPLTADITDVYINGVKLWYGDGSGDGTNSDYAINPVTRVISFGLNPTVGDTVSIVSREPTSVSSTPLPLIDSNGASVISENGGVISLSADTANVGSNALVVDASGNVLVGKTASAIGTAGFEALASGNTLATRDNGVVMSLNRQTSDGTILDLRKDGTTVGNIAARSGDLLIGTGAVGLRFDDNVDAYIPFNVTTSLGRDNAIDLGYSTVRFNDAYVTNGVTTGSDANEKTEITTSELGLDFINKINPVSYKFIGRYRTHYGMISQEIETLLSDVGKTSMDFAGFIKSPLTDEDGNETGEYRYGLRYTEFISPMIKAIQEQQTLIESQQSQIDALTARIETLESNTTP